MKKTILMAVVLSLCAAGVFALSPASSDPTIGVHEQSMDVFPPNHQPRTVALDRPELDGTKKAPNVTEETVGDPYSFGAKMVYLGVAQTLPVDLLDDCTGYDPEFGRCIEPNPAPASTSVNESDLGAIELPGKSTKTLICFTVTPFATWEWYNTTASQATAVMTLNTTVRIESDVLLDPSLVDPSGVPLNGVIDLGISTFFQNRTMDPNERDAQRHRTTRACTGGIVNEGSLRDVYGLSDHQIKDFFKNPITVSFGVSGDVALTTYVNYFVGIRLYGDK